MTDLRKAANMALYALEFSLPAIEDFGSKEQLTDCHRAIMALYKSLAQPEQEPVCDKDPSLCGFTLCQLAKVCKHTAQTEQAEYDKLTVKFGERAKEYLEAAKKSWEPKQEPVAWMLPDYGDVLSASEDDGTGIYNIPLYTAPQKYCPSENNAAYEKGFVEGMAKQMHSSVDRAVNTMVNPQMMQIKDGKMSYLKKPWQELTDEELVELREAHEAHIFNLMFAVEAKVKEKNGG